MSVVAAIQPPSITASMAERYGMRPDAFEATLRATVFPSTGTREEFAAFLMIAKEYQLNPILREIYAYPKKGGGIQPIVSVDGWANLTNSHPAFDGLEFVDHLHGGQVVSITCRIFRKDRARPIECTEYLAECHSGTEPWKRWPRRMLRHKAFVQAARYAFGFAGIVDQDEAERFTVSADKGAQSSGASLPLADKLQQLAQPPRPAPAEPSDDVPLDAGPIDPEPEDYDASASEELRLLREGLELAAQDGVRALRRFHAGLSSAQIALLDDGEWAQYELHASLVDHPPRAEHSAPDAS